MACCYLPRQKIMSNPLVTIVIPAYNCEKTIYNAINAVLRQSYQPVELIVVDDGSSDNTPKIIQSFESVIYIHQNNAGPAAARNRGAKEANGGIVFFTDSDCIADPDWIKNAMNGFTEDVSAVMGSYDIANPFDCLARCVHREILYRHAHYLPEYPKVFGSYNVGIRKNIFDQAGGYNPQYRRASGEDNDLSYKIIALGGRIRFCRNALVQHYHPVSLLKYLNEQFRHGFWRAKMYLDFPAMAKGDGYTFWKDMAEVALVMTALASAILCLFLFNIFKILLIFSLITLGLIQIYFSMRMIKDLGEAGYFAFVMLIRAFARTLGFMAGSLFFVTTSGKKSF